MPSREGDEGRREGMVEGGVYLVRTLFYFQDYLY